MSTIVASSHFDPLAPAALGGVRHFVSIPDRSTGLPTAVGSPSVREQTIAAYGLAQRTCLEFPVSPLRGRQDQDMETIPDHDSYIAAAPEAFRPVLDHLRGLLRDALPEAEEMMAYNMPGFRTRGTVVASYAAFSKQIGLYFLAPAIFEHADELAEAGFKTSKTGITFPPRKPVPDDLVTRLAQASSKHVND